MITLEDLFKAYYDCRKNKRKTINALEFELDYEYKLLSLYDDIINKQYKVWESIAFIVEKPVKREIFAWNFRDRVVHHLIYNKINNLFDEEFIYDSYSCRIWKWTHFWINRVNRFFRKSSDNFKKNTYVMKLDISWFFMNIDKNILFNNLKIFLEKKYKDDDLDLIMYLINEIIYNDCSKNCIIKSPKKLWVWLPKNKSLFFSWMNKWLPIWNLTSQIFGNFYLNSLDHYVKSKLKVKYYWRYVDDMIFLSNSKEELLFISEKVERFLLEKLFLTISHKKTYLENINRWVSFLWVFIKPYRTYIWNRTKNNFYKKINLFDSSNNEVNYFISSFNSYLWILKHYKTYKLRKTILSKLRVGFNENIWIENNYLKLKNLKK